MSEATQGFGSFGGVKFDKRLPDLPLGTYVVSLIDVKRQVTNKGPGTPDNVGCMTAVLVEGRESEGPHGYRIQVSGLQFPIYAARDMKMLTAAIMGLEQSDPRALALDTPDLGKIMENPAEYKGRRFVVTVQKSGRTEKNPKPGRKAKEYLDVTPRALLAGESFAPPVDTAEAQADRAEIAAENAAAAAVAAQTSAKPTPPALPAVDQNAGWFDFDPPDPRAGTHQYNEAGLTRAKV